MKKALVFIADGTEEIEVMTPVDFFRRAGLEVDLVAVKDTRKVRLAHKVYAGADKTIDEVNGENYDAFYIPGGLPGATNIRDNEKVIELIKEADAQGKILAAICAGPIVLEAGGILKDKNFTCYPGFEKEIKSGSFVDDLVVKDGNIFTGKGPAAAAYLTFALIEELLGKDKAEEIKAQTLFNLL